jgi:urea carboxylase
MDGGRGTAARGIRSRMIYDEPIFRPLGDCYVGIEFGDEADILLSFRVLALAEELRQAHLAGIIDMQPGPRQLAIIFDRRSTSHATIEAAAREATKPVHTLGELPSRVVTLPTWYDDPWSAATAERFGVPNNLAFVAEHNGMSKRDVIARHTECVHWNCAVGFTPGCNWYYPMDREQSLSAPTYDSPRTFTPTRAVGLLGSGTSTYPLESPGGIQLIGRVAADIYQRVPTHEVFGEDGVLLRAGDRIVHRAVDPLEYDEIREAIARGSYEFEVEDGTFDVADFLGRRQAAHA